MAATVTREAALCAAQEAMNMLLLAAGVTCTGKPVITPKGPSPGPDLVALLSAADAAIAAVGDPATDAQIETATDAVAAFSSAGGNAADKGRLEGLLANIIQKAADKKRQDDEAKGKDVNDKLKAFTDELNTLVGQAENFDKSQLLAPLRKIYDDLRAKQTESDNYIKALKDGEYNTTVLADTNAIKTRADKALRSIEDLTTAIKAELEAIREEVKIAKANLVPLDEYDSTIKEQRDAVEKAMEVTGRWITIENKAAFFIEGRHQTTEADNFKQTLQKYITKGNTNAAAAEKAAANAAKAAAEKAAAEKAAANADADKPFRAMYDKVSSTKPYPSFADIQAAYDMYDNLTPLLKEKWEGQFNWIKSEYPKTEKEMIEAISNLTKLGRVALNTKQLLLNALVDDMKNTQIITEERAKELHAQINAIKPTTSGGARRTRRNKSKARRTTRRS